jgi:hypothetical protein
MSVREQVARTAGRPDRFPLELHMHGNRLSLARLSYVTPQDEIRQNINPYIRPLYILSRPVTNTSRAVYPFSHYMELPQILATRQWLARVTNLAPTEYPFNEPYLMDSGLDELEHNANDFIVASITIRHTACPITHA